jgi:hypothetical protein
MYFNEPRCQPQVSTYVVVLTCEAMWHGVDIYYNSKCNISDPCSPDQRSWEGLQGCEIC